ncbi:MAG: hypothetical protein LC135_07335 [Phycisphaerae bacterium]|jgi:hypothetical protein|nr:hypothetical protein [Phycisphaerae bacterium]MCZ2399665.1 hypothetical protein [Phycisphaerae bacterium]
METALLGAGVGAPRRADRLRCAARWTAAALLAWAAGGKLILWGAFGQMLTALGLSRAELVPWAQAGVPAAELAIALLLALRLAPVLAAFALLLLSLLFAGVHGFALVSGEAIPCGCLGVALSHASWARHAQLLAVCALLAACALVLLFAPTAPSPRQRSADDSPAPGV